MATPGRSAFPLLRYFAFLSLACILLVAVPMGYVLHRYSQEALERIAGERNVGYATLLANNLWPEFRVFFAGAASLSDEELRLAETQRALRERITGLALGTQVLKVKIYDVRGRTLFSTDPTQTGQVQPSNGGILSAAAGRVASALTHRNTFDSFDRTLTDRDVLSSYIPVRGADKRVEGVFEIYADVTPFLAEMKELREAVVLTVGGSVGILYLMLSSLIWRAHRTIVRQQAALSDANRMLEGRVELRTRELSEANERLRAEMQERERAETGLQLAATVFENTSEGVLVTDGEQKVLAVNRAFCRITGYDPQDVVGRTPRLLKSGRQSEAFYIAFWEALNTRGMWSGEIWNRRKSGEIYPEWLSVSAVRDKQGRRTHYVAVFSDITAIKASQDRLDYLAHHDALTGLPNRVQLNRQLSAAIAEAREQRAGFALLFIDLDHFKHVNDTLGHSLGDRLLHAVGHALDTCLHGEALVARVGGDEFVAILNRDARSAEPVAHAVIDALAKPFLIDEHMLYVGASIGIVHFPEHGETAEALLSHADAAMYRAKATGRNTYRTYDRAMTDRARDRLALGSLLRSSFEEGGLFLQYHPQVDLASRRLTGVEALVRLRHPELGVIGPTRFIELAEEDGTIGRLGLWVLAEACRAMARWRARGVAVPKVSINVSVSQLDRLDLLPQLSALLAETGVPASCIELELTESVIMNADNALAKLEALRALGVSLAIDDFGTGYSSLSYLRHLPVQKIKIDRSFFVDMEQHDDAAAVVRGIVGLANSLALETVAEGVETQDQLDFLIGEGCHIVQGYIFGPPLDEADVATFRVDFAA